MRQDVWIPRNPQREQHQICVDYESEIWSVVTKMLCPLARHEVLQPAGAAHNVRRGIERSAWWHLGMSTPTGIRRKDQGA